MLKKKEREEKIHKLRTAWSKTAESHRLVWSKRDRHHDTNMAIQWGAITLSYSGLEQTLKYLVAVERKKTIEGVRKLFKKNGHDLFKIFGYLEEDTKETLREHYAVYQSLHSYIEIPTLDEFLCDVSRAPNEKDGIATGYERWRYLLIEEKSIPRNSAEAMLSIWSTAVRIAKRKEDPKISRRMLKGEIDAEIRKWLNRSPDKQCLGRRLNTFAKFIWNHERGRPDTFGGAPQEVREALGRWLEALDEEKLSYDTLFFIQRARGCSPLGLSIRWNDTSGRFEKVPWNLCPMTSDNCPEGAIEKDAIQLAYSTTRRDLVRELYRDFSVREQAQPTKTGLWTRTVSAVKHTDQGEEWRVEVWQRFLDNRIWVTWKGGESEAATDRKFELGLCDPWVIVTE